MRRRFDKKQRYVYENVYELIYMVRQRDDSAIQMLMDYFYEKMHIMIYRYYDRRSHMDRSDYYQLSVLKLFDAVDTFREDRETSFSFYYEKILRHTFTDIQRKAVTSFAYSLDNETMIDVVVQEHRGTYNPHLDGSDVLFMKQDALERCQKGLTAIERDILKLRLKGYQYKEIADILHIKKKKVDNTLYKVRYKKKIH